MTGLEPRADQAVRDAVDAFIEGRLSPGYSGETVFETKNSRYRLMDGILFSAPDASLIGAELVGWLTETENRSTVGSTWQATSRAVLVDRKRGRHIIVTSSTRMLHLEEDPSPSGSSQDQAGSSAHPPALLEESVAAAAPPLPSTPPLPRVHAPPRPMQPRIPQATAPKPISRPLPSRPLPYPAAPPRRVSPAPRPTAAATRMGPLPPPGRLPLPPPISPPHRPTAALDEAIEPLDCTDETDATEPNGAPFLLARPATNAVPPTPPSQPIPLGRARQRGALLR